MEDNLCDTCKNPMTIQRNKKGSRFLVCRNRDCARGARNAPPEEKNAKKPAAKPAIIPPAKRTGFSLGW